MAVERFLGGAWASVHGPSEPRQLLLWALDSGFDGLQPAPTPRAVDWAAIRAQMADLPVSFPAARLGSVLTAEPLAPALSSSREGDRKAALVVVAAAVEEMNRLGCQTIVLEPGLVAVPREDEVVDDLGDPKAGWTADRAKAAQARRKAALLPALDGACRSLHSLCKSFPDNNFCLVSGRNVWSVADRVGLEAIFEDLAGCRLGHGHDAPVVARRAELLGEEPGEWLEGFSNLLRGITLGDTAGGALYLPPGMGGVDYPLIRSYVHRSGGPMPAVLELDPGVDAADIPGVHAFLDKFGL